MVGHRLDPQKIYKTLRDSLSFEPLCIKIHRRVTSVAEPGKKLNKKEDRPYISRICPDTPLIMIRTDCWLRVLLVDVFNCAKFYRNKKSKKNFSLKVKR